MLAVDYGWSKRQAGSQNPIETRPVSRMYEINIALAEQFTKAENQPHIISRTLVQFVISDRALEPLKKLSAAMKKT